jgi:hypothetical protein
MRRAHFMTLVVCVSQLAIGEESVPVWLPECREEGLQKSNVPTRKVMLCTETKSKGCTTRRSVKVTGTLSDASLLNLITALGADVRHVTSIEYVSNSAYVFLSTSDPRFYVLESGNWRYLMTPCIRPTA